MRTDEALQPNVCEAEVEGGCVAEVAEELAAGAIDEPDVFVSRSNRRRAFREAAGPLVPRW